VATGIGDFALNRLPDKPTTIYFGESCDGSLVLFFHPKLTRIIILHHQELFTVEPAFLA
jgi:hypothetical protein